MQSEQNTAGTNVVALTFTAEGAKKFADATAANVGKTITVFLDDMFIASPSVNEAITGGSAVIPVSLDSVGTEELARMIREGPLPFALETLAVNNVSAQLGDNALNMCILAGIIGTALVLILMAAVYRLSGLAADISLIIYIGIVLISLSFFGILLTLPGIGGIILSLAITVGAEVIILERIREEAGSGKSNRTAVDIGYRKAFPAVIDSHVTAVIAAAALFWLGSGPIKGFAQTLIIGIIASALTVLIVTRFIIKSLEGSGLNAPKLFIPIKKEA